jgi:RNA polymerase sigma factor (sigma-70 family)
MEGAVLASRNQLSRATLELAANGDRTAFGGLVAAHHADLLRVCFVILGDPSLAEDAAQSAWIKAWRKLGQLREPDKVRPWLIAVAANEARQLARRRRLHPNRPPEEYGPEADPALTDLAVVLRNLSTDDRRLLTLRYVSELTSEEMGKFLGLTAGAVRHRLMRLVSRLRVELDR